MEGIERQSYFRVERRPEKLEDAKEESRILPTPQSAIARDLLDVRSHPAASGSHHLNLRKQHLLGARVRPAHRKPRVSRGVNSAAKKLRFEMTVNIDFLGWVDEQRLLVSCVSDY
jgi:hypothetical protein